MTPDHDPTRTANPDATRTSADPATVSHPTDGDLGTATLEAVRALEALRNGSTPPPTSPVEPPPGFVIEGELGIGGMGVVYLARQVGLNRSVALKLVKGGTAVDAKALIRFLAEAEAVAAVKHPNVVEVYQYGEHLGRPYLALEYCPGGDLTSLVSREATPSATKDAAWFRRVADLMAKVADGVHAAHAQGIVHRDLKPHNVFLTADGTPKVADFGLAKRGVGSDLTHTGAVMGTPAYMAPEQAGGGTKFVGPEADVWALGVMLYELCCGERPIDTTGPLMDALARVANPSIPSLSTKLPAVPTDLSLIAHKCLTPDPRDRYPTAGGLATDLRNWLDGKPISARRAGVIEQAVKWVNRNRIVSTAVATVATALLLSAAVSIVFAFDSRESALRADEARKDEAKARVRAEITAASAQTDLDLRLLEHGEVELGLLRLSQTLQRLPAEAGELRDFLTMAVLVRGQLLTTGSRLHSGEGDCVAVYAPDHRTTVLRFAARPDEIELWQLTPGVNQPTKKLQSPGVRHVQYAANGAAFTSIDADGNAAVWDSRTGEAIGHVPRAATTGRSTTTTFDVVTGESVMRAEGDLGDILVSPTGRHLVTYDGRTPRLWDVPAGKLVAGLSADGKPPGVELRFSPCGRWVYTPAWAEGWGGIWDSASGGMVADCMRKEGGNSPSGERERGACRLAFSPSGNMAAVLHHDTQRTKRPSEAHQSGAKVDFVSTSQWNGTRDWAPAGLGVPGHPGLDDPAFAFQFLGEECVAVCGPITCSLLHATSDRFLAVQYSDPIDRRSLTGRSLRDKYPEVESHIPFRVGDYIVTDSGKALHVPTWEWAPTESGRFFPSALSDKAIAGRYVPLRRSILDCATRKVLPLWVVEEGELFLLADVATDLNAETLIGAGRRVQRQLYSPVRPSLDARALALWVELITSKRLDDGGQGMKPLLPQEWDERRAQLAQLLCSTDEINLLGPVATGSQAGGVR